MTIGSKYLYKKVLSRSTGLVGIVIDVETDDHGTFLHLRFPQTSVDSNGKLIHDLTKSVIVSCSVSERGLSEKFKFVEEQGIKDE